MYLRPLPVLLYELGYAYNFTQISSQYKFEIWTRQSLEVNINLKLQYAQD